MYFPVFYLIWGIYNRKKIHLIYMVPVLLLSIFIAVQFNNNFFSGRLQLDWLTPTHNEILLYGAFCAMIFLVTRLSLYKARLKTMNKYVFATFVSIWSLLLLLSPILIMRHALYLKSGNFAAADMLTLELPVVLWVLFTCFLHLKCPEDGLIQAVIDLKPILQRWAGTKKR